MKNAAGILIATEDLDEFLLFKRSKMVSSPGTYSIPGGMRKSDNLKEKPLETALREAGEEIGKIPKGELNKFPFTYQNKKLTYKTFLLTIDPNEKENYLPKLDPEHDSYIWVKTNNLHNYNLHPGLRNVLSQIITP